MRAFNDPIVDCCQRDAADCDCPTYPTYHATKYDSARDEVVALLADEVEGFGNRDDSTGTVDAPTGHVAFVSIPGDVEWQHTSLSYSADAVALTYGVTPAEVAGFHIVTHNSQGFVSVETFATEDEARAEFDCRAARFAEWDGHEDICPLDCADGTGTWDGCQWDGVYICPVPGHGYHTL